MISEQVLLALLKQPDTRTNGDIELISSFCRLFSVLNEIPEHLYHSFCRIVEVDEFDTGSVIYNEGDMGSDWFIIIEGSVNIVSASNSTNPVRGVMKIGDSFGRSALTQEVIRTETVSCLEHVFVLRLGRKQYQEMIQSANNGMDSESQGFASEFTQKLNPITGMNISTSISRVVFPSNAVIVKQGEEPTGVYYILSGSAGVVREVEFKSTAKGPVCRLIEIDELFPNSMISIRSLCLNEPEKVSVIAKSELVALFLSRSDFYRKVDVQKQKESLPADYPDDASIRKLFQKQMRWEEYKRKVVREVLSHKKSRRALGLPY